MLPANIYWILTWWSMLASRTWEVIVARLLCKPVAMFPNSVGPFRTMIGRLFTKMALNNCSVILIREPVSYGVVDSLKIRSPKILTSDTALLFNTFHTTAHSRKLERTIGVSPGVYSHSLSKRMIQNYVLAHAKALDSAIEKYGFSVVFLPHYVTGFGQDDLEISKLIVSHMKHGEKTKITCVKTVREFEKLISQMEMVISSKMHPAVLAASAHVPFLYIAYDYKQTGFASSLGVDDCVLPIRAVSYEKLSSKIDYVWKNLAAIRNLLKTHVPKLQKNVKDSIAFAIARSLKADKGEAYRL